MIQFDFSYNEEYDTFTHEASGYILSREYVKAASNDEVIKRVVDNTGFEPSVELVEFLRTGWEPHPPVEIEELPESRTNPDPYRPL